MKYFEKGKLYKFGEKISEYEYIKDNRDNLRLVDVSRRGILYFGNRI